MTVYVDDMEAKFGRMVMCHMIADSTEELLAMADKIGVARRWIQHAGTYKEHFDIALSKRELAIKNGAKQITWTQLGRLTMCRPGSPLKHWPKCETCKKELAACIGAYESVVKESIAFACDKCCGHGNEDGWCDRLPGVTPR